MKKLIYIFLLFVTTAVFSQNNGITYQAVIYMPGGQNAPGVNVSNVPMTNKNICLQFSLLDANNRLEYQEEVKVKTDEFGMVNITIGNGVQSGGYASSYTAIVWNALSQKNLQVAFDSTGLCNQFDPLSNEPINSIPFANAAITAGNVTGVVALVNGGTGATTAAGARANLGIGNIDNTSDLDKPISTATKNYVDNQLTSGTIVDADATTKGKIQLAGDLAGTAGAPTVPGLALKENAANKSTTTTLGTSNVLFPTQNAVKTYVDTAIAGATIVDADATTKGKIQLAGDLAGTAGAPTVPGLALKENAANKSTTTTLGTSDVLFPTQNAVKTYVDNAVSGATIVDADANNKGKIKLAGDLTGTADAPTIASNAITDIKIATVSGSKITGNIPGNATNVTGVVDITNGGTGATSVPAARTNLGLGSAALNNTGDFEVPLSFASPLVRTVNSIAVPPADATVNGYLKATDFYTFSNKISSTEKAANNGVATLGNDGKIPSSQIPSISFQSVNVVNSQAAMIANSAAQVGSITIRTDINRNFVLSSLPASTLSNWIELSTPNSVTSVNGYAGPNVSLTKADIVLGNVDNTSDNNKPISIDTRAALDLKANLASPTFTGTVSGITKTMVGLGNVDNTTDAGKPVSTATQTALDLKANAADVTTSLALKANVTDVTTSLALKANVTDVTTSLALKEDTANKTINVTTDGASDVKFPSAKAVKTYADSKVVDGIIDAVTTTSPSQNAVYDALQLKENTANKSTAIDLGSTNPSDVLFPSQKAVKTYVDLQSANAGVADASLTSAKILDGTLVAADFADGSVTTPKLATNAVTTAKITDANVTNAKLDKANIPLSGFGAAAADVALGANKLTGVADPTAAQDAATKNYVDIAIAGATIADADANTKGKIKLAGDLAGTAASPTVPGLALKEDVSNKSTTITLGTSNSLYPTQNAVKTYADAKVVDGIADTVTTSAPTQNAVFDALALKANLASPTFTGTPTAPTPATADNSTTIATTEYVKNSIVAANAGLSTIGNISATSNAKGAVINGTTELVLTPADATNGGVVTTGAQTFAGAKTFGTDITVNGLTVGKGGGNNLANTAVGSGALALNTSGSGSTAFGYKALSKSTAGNATAFGTAALENLTTGSANVAIGYATLNQTSSQNYNTAVGDQAMRNSTGANNTVLGASALSGVAGQTNGNNNTALGTFVLRNATTAAFNVGVGSNSLNNITTGNDNTVLGYLSGYYAGAGTGTNLTNMSQGVLIGSNVRTGTNTSTNEIAIGYNVVGNGSNTVTIGNSSVTGNYFNGNITTTGQLTSTVATGIAPLVVTSTTPVANLNIAGNATNVTGTVAIANGGTGATTAAAALTNLGAEPTANKSTATDLGNTAPSDQLFPSQKAVKAYVDAQTAAAGVSDGSITSAKIADGTIVNVDVATNAAIAYSKLNLASSIVVGDLADDAVETTKIKDTNVTAAKLATDAVETLKIKDAAVTNAKLDKINIPLSGFGAATADVALGGKKLTGVGNPTAAQDVATKSYVDTLNASAGVSDGSITYAKIQNVADNKVLGNFSGSTGPVQELGTTGTGNVVRATSPTLVTPTLGAATATTVGFSGATSGIATITAPAVAGTTTVTLPAASGTLATLDGAETLTNKTLTSPTLTAPVLGTPASGTLTNATGLPIATGVSGLGTGVATALATPSSANVLAAVTDETGTGALVFATSPTLVTPVLGVATATSINGLTPTAQTTGFTIAGGTTSKTLTVSGDATVSGSNTGDQTTITGNAGTATKLAATKNINGVAFDGSADITVTADASTLTGTSLKSTVVGSSLTSVGTLTNLTVTNAIAGSITGNAATVTTNANLTGPITSVGNATSVASQTGTGSKFVMDTSPTLVTPVLGVATATSINGLTPTALATGFTIAGGSTTSKTLTVSGDATVSGTTSGTNTGDQTITLTGDVTGSGTGSFAATIGTGKVTTSTIAADAITSAKIADATIVVGDLAADAVETAKIKDANVTYAKIQNVSATDKVLGRISSGAGVIEEIATTGSGNVVRATSPTLVTPVIGAATGTSLSVSGQLTSTVATGTAPLVVTSTTPVANLSIGGTATTATNIAGGAIGSVPYQSAAGTTALLAGNTTATAKFLTSTGTGTAATAPTWTTISAVPYTGATGAVDLGAYDLKVNGLTVGRGGNGVAVSNANTTFGISALSSSSTSGSGANTAIGNYVLGANTSGSYNTGLGFYALAANVTGTDNTAVGSYALKSNNSSSSDNTAIGSNAMYSNTSGTENTAVGSKSLYKNTTGIQNSIFGRYAYFNGEGSYNTAVGYRALMSPNASGNTGEFNVSMGYYSGYSLTTGSQNLFLGSNAGFNITTGGKNIMLGSNAGNYVGSGSTLNSTGLNSVLIGYDVRPLANADTNEIVLSGYNGTAGTVGLGSNTTLIGNSTTTNARIMGALNLPNATTSTTTTTGALTVGGGVGIVENLNVGGNVKITGTLEIDGGTPAAGEVLTSDANGLATWTAPTGVTILSGISTSGTANGATISGNTLNLNAASSSFGGVVTTGTQTFAGAKTFNSDLNVNGLTVGKGPANFTTLLGQEAGSAMTSTGTNNVAVGYQALKTNSSGSDNVAIGSLAGTGITTGASNVAIGKQALRNLTTSYSNIAIGAGSLAALTTASGNVAVGEISGGGLTTGDYNINIGSSSGRYIGTSTTSNTTGNYNVMIGFDTRPAADGETNEIVLAGYSGSGNGAVGQGSHSTTIGNSATTKAVIYGSSSLSNLPTTAASGAAGGNFTLTAQNANGTNTKGGDIVLKPGTATGTGAAGIVKLNSQIQITGGTPGLGKVLTSDANGLATWSNNGGGVLSKTATYTILTTDNANVLVFSGSTASQTITLPSAVTVGAGREITIKNVASVSVAIASAAGYLISDSTTTTATGLNIGVEPSNNWIKAISDGTNWIILRALF